MPQGTGAWLSPVHAQFPAWQCGEEEGRRGRDSEGEAGLRIQGREAAAGDRIVWDETGAPGTCSSVPSTSQQNPNSKIKFSTKSKHGALFDHWQPAHIAGPFQSSIHTGEHSSILWLFWLHLLLLTGLSFQFPKIKLQKKKSDWPSSFLFSKKPPKTKTKTNKTKIHIGHWLLSSQWIGCFWVKCPFGVQSFGA